MNAHASPGTPVCIARRNGWSYRALAVLAFVYLGLLLAAPLVAVFTEAFHAGWLAYARSLVDRDTRHAIGLTLLVASIVVPLNSLFGLAAAWTLAKFDFRGKNFWITLIDIPFSVSPVVAGVFYLMLYGAHGLLGPWLQSHGITVAFSVTGIVLVNLFVTLPFVVRELLPLMQAQGNEEEEAALSLGASGWQLFWKITLPNVKWALFYGIILCNARSMGEFGAATVIAGAIRGETTTLPLHAEILFNEYNAAGAFAVASLLTLLALVSLVARHCVERCEQQWIQAAAPVEPSSPQDRTNGARR